MTETAETVIKDALGLLQIRADEEPLEAADAQVAIRTLNRMMAMFQTKSIYLGFTLVSKLNDIITVSDDAIDGIISNLAVKLHPHFKSGELSQTLLMLAKAGYDSLLDIAIEAPESSFPDTLPVGSGNEETYWSDAFYPASDEEISTELTQTIATETDTEDEVS